MLDNDRIRGSLIGGAIGDALGYPVEFICDYRAIQQKYGERGIIRYDRWKGESGQDEKAWISDDTQIGMPGKKPLDCWISHLPEINQRRAPGNTCLSALPAPMFLSAHNVFSPKST